MMPGELEETDRLVVSFCAAHDFVLLRQVRRVADEDLELVGRRMDRLVDEGLVARAPRLRHQLGAFRVTERGLDRLGSDLPLPGFDLRRLVREQVVAWLWVSAQVGLFGEVDGFFSPRQMQAMDRTAAAPSRLGLVSAALREKLIDARFGFDVEGGVACYPDFVVVSPEGRVPFEVAMSAPSAEWVRGALRAVAGKPQVAHAVFLVPPGCQERVAEEAVRWGLGDRVRVQHFVPGFD